MSHNEKKEYNSVLQQASANSHSGEQVTDGEDVLRIYTLLDSTNHFNTNGRESLLHPTLAYFADTMMMGNRASIGYYLVTCSHLNMVEGTEWIRKAL